MTPFCIIFGMIFSILIMYVCMTIPLLPLSSQHLSAETYGIGSIYIFGHHVCTNQCGKSKKFPPHVNYL